MHKLAILRLNSNLEKPRGCLMISTYFGKPQFKVEKVGFWNQIIWTFYKIFQHFFLTSAKKNSFFHWLKIFKWWWTKNFKTLKKFQNCRMFRRNIMSSSTYKIFYLIISISNQKLHLSSFHFQNTTSHMWLIMALYISIHLILTKKTHLRRLISYA